MRIEQIQSLDETDVARGLLRAPESVAAGYPSPAHCVRLGTVRICWDSERHFGQGFDPLRILSRAAAALHALAVFNLRDD